MSKVKDISNKKFGRLVAKKMIGSDNLGHAIWLCTCDCGKEITLPSLRLLSGNTKSCGCLKKDLTIKRNFKHGLTYKMERMYNNWVQMKGRCFNENNSSYNNYGARGIKVCEEWLNFSNFSNWALQNGYKEGLTIERIDFNGDYEPLNCKWIQPKLQARNKTTSHFITFENQTKTLVEWSEIYGIEASLIRYRLKRWPISDIFNKPKKIKKAI